MSRLDLIMDWVERGEQARYQERELAMLCGVSSGHLRRYWRQVFGRTARRWLQELRLWHAAKLLCSGQLVKEVAHNLYYSSESQLCHEFRAFHKVAPLAFVAHYLAQQKAGKTKLLNPSGMNSTKALNSSKFWEEAERAMCRKNGAVHFSNHSQHVQNARHRQ